MQDLYQYDLSLFHLINQAWTHPALDAFFPWWTDFHKTSFFAYAFVPLVLVCIFLRAKWSGLLFLVVSLIAVGIDDGFCGQIVKPYFARLRPPVAGIDVILRAAHYGGYSFPSNHAANTFCLAAFVGVYYPRLRIPLFFLAALTAYSRVYCGVHYPSDVIGGALLGALLGWVLARLFRPVWAKIHERVRSKENAWQKS